MQISWLKGPMESGGFSENCESGEILPTFFIKGEDFMQMSWLKGPIEGGGFGENGRLVKMAKLAKFC